MAQPVHTSCELSGAFWILVSPGFSKSLGVTFLWQLQQCEPQQLQQKSNSNCCCWCRSKSKGKSTSQLPLSSLRWPVLCVSVQSLFQGLILRKLWLESTKTAYCKEDFFFFLYWKKEAQHLLGNLELRHLSCPSVPCTHHGTKPVWLDSYQHFHRKPCKLVSEHKHYSFFSAVEHLYSCIYRYMLTDQKEKDVYS